MSIKWNPTILVLGPGGMEGFLELGVILKLYNVGMLQSINTYIGCSAGSIISLLLVAGYTPLEIIAQSTEISLFSDISSIKMTDISSLVLQVKKNSGLLSHNSIKERLIICMRQKFGFIPTLYQLYLSTGLTLISVSLNLDTDNIEYFSWKNNPDLLCVDASILSMNIPFLFYKLQYNNSIYIDGAFGDPYPVKLLDDGKTDILGVHIESDNPYHGKSLEHDDLRYLNKVLHASMTQLKKRNQQESSDRVKHLNLYSPTPDITGITYNDRIKEDMVAIGYSKTTEFLSNQGIKIHDSFNWMEVKEIFSNDVEYEQDDEDTEEEE